MLFARPDKVVLLQLYPVIKIASQSSANTSAWDETGIIGLERLIFSMLNINSFILLLARYY